jgi:hypothetical protein
MSCSHGNAMCGTDRLPWQPLLSGWTRARKGESANICPNLHEIMHVQCSALVNKLRNCKARAASDFLHFEFSLEPRKVTRFSLKF